MTETDTNLARRGGSSTAAAKILLLGWSLPLLTACPARALDEARALEAEGHLQEAGERYVAIAREDPANLAAWNRAVDLWCRKSTNVGECMSVLDLELHVLGNVDRHKEALAEVLEARARARLQQGLVDAALDDLSRAERAMPKRASVYTARARALAARRDRDEAIAALHRARELDPQNPEIAEILAQLDAAAQPPPSSPDEGFGGAADHAPPPASPPRR